MKKKFHIHCLCVNVKDSVSDRKTGKDVGCLCTSNISVIPFISSTFAYFVMYTPTHTHTHTAMNIYVLSLVMVWWTQKFCEKLLFSEISHKTKDKAGHVGICKWFEWHACVKWMNFGIWFCDKNICMHEMAMIKLFFKVSCCGLSPVHEMKKKVAL
jgi:hypothetical protein